MRLSYIIVVLAIILLVGCAQTTTTPIEPTTPPETLPEIISEELRETTPEVTVAEIEILVKGYNPEELTVKKGTTVRWINTAPGKRILRGSVWSPALESGDTYEYTFEEAGEYVILETLSKARGKVIVTE